MSKKYEILELLKHEEYTIKEIAGHLKFNENDVRVYINRLKKDGLIKEIGKKKRYIIYAAKEQESQNNDHYNKIKEGFNQFNNLFESLIKNSQIIIKNSQIDNFKLLIKEKIDINLIKELNSEMSF